MPAASEPRAHGPGRGALLAVLVLLVALIGAVDYWTGAEVLLTISSLVPIGLGA